MGFGKKYTLLILGVLRDHLAERLTGGPVAFPDKLLPNRKVGQSNASWVVVVCLLFWKAPRLSGTDLVSRKDLLNKDPLNKKRPQIRISQP